MEPGQNQTSIQVESWLLDAEDWLARHQAMISAAVVLVIIVLFFLQVTQLNVAKQQHRQGEELLSLFGNYSGSHCPKFSGFQHQNLTH